MNALSSQIKFFIWEHPGCTFLSIAGDFDPSKRITCGEIWKAIDELRDEKEILIEGEGYNETFRIRPGDNCMVEAIQDITINAYERLYASREDPDSREVLSELREWAKEFEDYWWNLPLSKQASIGYLEAIDDFCEKKLSGNPFLAAARKIRGILKDNTNLLEIELPQQGTLYCSKIKMDGGQSAVIHWGCDGDWHRALNIPESEFEDIERVAAALEWFDNQ